MNDMDAQLLMYASSSLIKETGGSDDERLNRCDAVAVMMGGQNDEVAYSKTASLHVGTSLSPARLV